MQIVVTSSTIRAGRSAGLRIQSATTRLERRKERRKGVTTIFTSIRRIRSHCPEKKGVRESLRKRPASAGGNCSLTLSQTADAITCLVASGNDSTALSRDFTFTAQ